jgi:hypothetical protein
MGLVDAAVEHRMFGRESVFDRRQVFHIHCRVFVVLELRGGLWTWRY